MPATRIVGFGLLGLSTLLYLALLAVPFTPLTFEVKVAVSAALVVGGEAAFWLGGLILGRELLSRYGRALNPLRWVARFRSPKREDSL